MVLSLGNRFLTARLCLPQACSKLFVGAQGQGQQKRDTIRKLNARSTIIIMIPISFFKVTTIVVTCQILIHVNVSAVLVAV